MTRTSQSHGFMFLKLFFRGVEFETLDKANPDGLEFSFCLWWLNSKQLDSCKRFWSYFWLNLNAFMEFTIVLCVCSVVSSSCCVCASAFTCNNKQMFSLKTWQYTDRMTACLLSLENWKRRSADSPLRGKMPSPAYTLTAFTSKSWQKRRRPHTSLTWSIYCLLNFYANMRTSRNPAERGEEQQANSRRLRCSLWQSLLTGMIICCLCLSIRGIKCQFLIRLKAFFCLLEGKWKGFMISVFREFSVFTSKNEVFMDLGRYFQCL